MGDLRFNEWQDVDGNKILRSNAGVLEVWDGAAWGPAGANPVAFEYVVVAGGGSGSSGNGAGGAGGYRCNVPGESSGGGGIAESALNLAPGDYTVTVGAGGAVTSNGSDTTFGTITSIGGGSSLAPGVTAASGGSGGGASRQFSPAGSTAGGAGTIPQGFAGGRGWGDTVSYTNGGGGGGAAGSGGGVGSSTGNPGGDGVASSITGSSVYRAGGGGSAGNAGGSPGGLGGGGNSGSPGVANTGGGAGAGQNGGSGVVILKYPDTTTLTIGAGLTASTITSGGFNITTFTAGTDTVSF